VILIAGIFLAFFGASAILNDYDHDKSTSYSVIILFIVGIILIITDHILDMIEARNKRDSND
jgi:Ca2+/Na+ antiporter